MPARNLALSSFSPRHWFTSAVSREKIEKERGKKEKENESNTKERERERDSFERTSLTSRPLRISFTVTDIRHGQRSSSSGRRRNRDRKKKKKEAEALDEQKGSRHARHAHEPYFSSSRCLLLLLLLPPSPSPRLPPRAHSSSTSSIVSTQHPTSREKAHTGASRLFLFNGRGQNKPPPTATPISSRHAERELRTLIHNATRVTRSCKTRRSSATRRFCSKDTRSE